MSTLRRKELKELALLQVALAVWAYAKGRIQGPVSLFSTALSTRSVLPAFLDQVALTEFAFYL